MLCMKLLQTSMYSQSSGFFSHKEDPSNHLEEPWEAEYQVGKS